MDTSAIGIILLAPTLLEPQATNILAKARPDIHACEPATLSTIDLQTISDIRLDFILLPSELASLLVDMRNRRCGRENSGGCRNSGGLNMAKRWNGGSFFIAGFMFLGLALALYFFAANTDTHAYLDDANEGAIQTQFRLLIVGHGCVGMSVFLISIGCIVRAIWFLPGDEEKAFPERKRR